MYSARAGWWHASSSLAWFQIQVQDRSQPSSDDDAVVEMTGSDFRIVTVDKGLMKAEPWLNHQPFGQMPYLLDDENGLEVFESRALIRYAAAKINSNLLPTPEKGIKEFAAFETACAFEMADFDGPATGIWFEHVGKKMRGLEFSQAALDGHKAVLAKKLEGYERVLSKSKYLAGPEMTLADLFYLPYGTQAVVLGGAPGMTDGTFPNVARWWKEISTLENWTKRNEIPDGSVMRGLNASALTW
ncbi:MAG: hypothetical protein CYPHOPRED_001978 [Cyphobasidiales sp. Tagirdzhanova-0007]|nr:MAG: hypothetical protein CYPHOPRED_001978 [Cyphobasidiales sp. Tagirdzhanova-0007]